MSARAYLERAAARLQEPAFMRTAGLTLIAAALVVAIAGVRPLLARQEEQANELAALATLAPPAERATAAAAAPEAQLERFYASFPEPGEIAAVIGRIDRIAQLHGLVLTSGEYALERTPSRADSRIERHRAVYGLNGHYGQIRGFVAQLLAEMPFVSLEDLRLKRATPAAADLETRLTVAIYTATRRGGGA